MDPARRAAARLGLLVALLYVVLAVLWRFTAECGTGAFVFLWAAITGNLPDLNDAQAPQAMQELVGPAVLGVSFLVMATGLVAIATGLAMWQRWQLPHAFAIRRPAWVALAVAVVGGVTVGLLPAWLAQWLAENAPSLDLGNLDALEKALTDGTPVGTAILGFAVVFAAPVLEELVFRGFLWGALERALPTWAVWLVTSVLFAMFHIDPVHVIALLFTALFLGWVRWMGGSIWPAIAAHFVNNGWAAVAASFLPEDADTWLTLGVALAGAGFTLALGAVAFAWRRPSHEVSTATGPAS